MCCQKVRASRTEQRVMLFCQEFLTSKKKIISSKIQRYLLKLQQIVVISSREHTEKRGILTVWLVCTVSSVGRSRKYDTKSPHQSFALEPTIKASLVMRNSVLSPVIGLSFRSNSTLSLNCPFSCLWEIARYLKQI